MWQLTSPLLAATVETARDVLEIAGAVLTALAISRAARAGFVRTVGRRRHARRQLNRLAPLTQIDYFTAVLGEPAFRLKHAEYTEYIFVDPQFYVQALSSFEDDAVLQYSVTSRSTRFRPKVEWWTGTRYMVIKLGKTSFSKSGETPTEVLGTVGARRFGYSETYYFGNPGKYLTHILALNDAAPFKGDAGDLSRMTGPGGTLERRLTGDAVAQFVSSADGHAFRRNAAPNTYTVVSPMTEPIEMDWQGADLDVVRVLP